jgi:7-cyano-7-deazaguanine synthase in queuosine biosynthesis
VGSEKVIAVDIDGVLTKEIEGWGEVYLKRTPLKNNIEVLRDYKRRGFKIILYTSRHPEDLNLTKKWLVENDVVYDEIVLGKPHADLYVDDLSTSQLSKEVLCVSGGVDSTIAFFYLNKPQPIYFKLNHKYERKEMNCLKKLEKKIDGFTPLYEDSLKLGRFEWGDNTPHPAYIPLRNLFLAMLASMYGERIYIVGVKGDRVEDKSPEAYKVMSFAINFIKKPIEKKVEILSPFWEMSKGEVVKWFVNNYGKEYAKDILYTSVSCYDDKTLGQCGRCNSCFRKWIGLEVGGIECVDLFEEDIRKWEGISDYIRRVKEGEYDAKRSEEIRKVLMKYGLWK